MHRDLGELGVVVPSLSSEEILGHGVSIHGLARRWFSHQNASSNYSTPHVNTYAGAFWCSRPSIGNTRRGKAD